MEGISAILTGSPVTGTGGVTRAPLGGAAAKPTDATTPLDVAFLKQGYIGEDGVIKSIDSSDEKIKAWGGDTVKVVRQEHSVGYKFTFLESGNATTLKAMFGEENVIVTPPTSTKAGSVELRTTSAMVPEAQYTLEMKDAPATIREYIPVGQLTVSGDVNFVHSNIISYQVAIEALPDADGVKSYSFIDDGTPTG